MSSLHRSSPRRRARARTLLGAALAVGSLVVVGLPLGQATAAGTSLDVDFAEIVFDYTDHTNITPTTPDCLLADTSAYCVGKNTGDIVRFNNVVSVGGQSVDAVVTTVNTASAAISRYEVSSSSEWTANPTWFWTRTDISSAGAATEFNLAFYLAGTYTGPGTGTPATLRNVAFSAIEIDNNQFVRFSEVQGYTLAAVTELTFDDATGTFQSSATNGDAADPKHRVVVTFSAISSFDFAFGRITTNSTNNFSLAGLNLGFGDVEVIEHGPVEAETPDPIDEGTPVPDIGFITTPPTENPDWETLPECAVYASSDTGFTSPLSGTVPAGTYVTHCSGGSSTTFVPTDYIDGELVVTPVPPGPEPGPAPAPSPVTPRFTG